MPREKLLRLNLRFDKTNYDWLKEQCGEDRMIAPFLRQLVTNQRLKYENLKQIKSNELIIDESEEEIKKENSYYGIAIDGPRKGELIKSNYSKITFPLPNTLAINSSSYIIYIWSQKGWTLENESVPRSGD